MQKTEETCRKCLQFYEDLGRHNPKSNVRCTPDHLTTDVRSYLSRGFALIPIPAGGPAGGTTEFLLIGSR